MYFTRNLLCIFAALTLVGCGGGGVTEPEAPAPRATSFDGEVLRITVPREDGGRRNPDQAKGRSTVEPVVSRASMARWTSAASRSG